MINEKNKIIIKHIVLNILLIPLAFICGIPFCFFIFFLSLFFNNEIYALIFILFLNLITLFVFIKRKGYIKIIYFLNFIFWISLGAFLFFSTISKQ